MVGAFGIAPPQSRVRVSTACHAGDACPVIYTRALGPRNDMWFLLADLWRSYPPPTGPNNASLRTMGRPPRHMLKQYLWSPLFCAYITTRAQVRRELLPNLSSDHRVSIARPPPLYFPPLLVDCAPWDSGRTPCRRPRDRDRRTCNSRPGACTHRPRTRTTPTATQAIIRGNLGQLRETRSPARQPSASHPS